MLKFTRITATFVGDAHMLPEPDYKIIMNALVQDDQIVKGEFFGKVHDGEDGTWPFILTPPVNLQTMWRMDFGAGSDSTLERIGISGKLIRPGTLFTRWYGDEEEWTYRITNVHAV